MQRLDFEEKRNLEAIFNHSMSKDSEMKRSDFIDRKVSINSDQESDTVNHDQENGMMRFKYQNTFETVAELETKF